MIKRNALWTVLLAGLAMGACAPTKISPNWGIAYRDAITKQVLNPTAGEQLEPVEGQDGTVNRLATEAYRSGFEKPDSTFTKSAVSSGIKTQ